MDDARKLLDSLMGSHRNVDKEEAAKKKGQNFLEDNVCKRYLVGFCPQFEDLFHSTKRNIGSCSKVHSEAMKKELEAHPDREKYSDMYLGQLKTYLEELVRSAEDWAARERRNVAAANAHIEESGPNEVARFAVQELQDQVKTLIEEADNLAEDGKVEEAKLRMEEAEILREKASGWENKAKSLRTEDVCEICGSRMESGDIGRAKSRHLESKIHIGYVKIRKWLEDITEKLKDNEEKRPKKDEKVSDGKDRRRSRSRSRNNGDRGKDRRRSRSRSRKNHDRGKDRQRSRSGARANDRDRDRDRRRDGGRDRDRGRDRQRH